MAATGLAAAAILAMALPASAHVTLHSYEATQGGSDAIIQVRVPNEESNATTTKLELDFPADAPIIGLYVEPTPGWQFQTTVSNLPKPVTNDDGTFTQYVSQVVWTGGNIPVGGFVDFNIDASDLPNVPTLELKALQTYANGDVVRWIDTPAAPGQPDPPHPQPTLALTPASSGDGSTPTTAAAAGAPTPSTKGLATSSDVNGAKALSIAALVVGIVGLLIATAALVTRRRTAG
ncbi:MAG TPA: YcnI family protein [Acidimicrobiales bacterium]|nr:YcnI family protein [Acidimicrobiales bacterium]